MGLGRFHGHPASKSRFLHRTHARTTRAPITRSLWSVGPAMLHATFPFGASDCALTAKLVHTAKHFYPVKPPAPQQLMAERRSSFLLPVGLGGCG